MLGADEKRLAYALSLKAVDMGRECGEFCDHWIDRSHQLSLSTDAEREEYFKRSFLPSLVISAADGKVKVTIRCTSCDWRHWAHTEVTAPELFCKKQFPILEKLLEEEFNKFLRKDSAQRLSDPPESSTAD